MLFSATTLTKGGSISHRECPSREFIQSHGVPITYAMINTYKDTLCWERLHYLNQYRWDGTVLGVISFLFESFWPKMNSVALKMVV